MKLWPFLLVFALAVGFGVMISQDPGYTLFAYKNWTVEMPLWIAVIFLVIIIIASIAFLSFFNLLFSSPRRVKGWWYKHKQLSARKNTSRGLVELAEGDWKKAEKHLTRGASYSDIPLINYLSAAHAADERGAIDRRNQYLQQAGAMSKGSDVAVKLTEAHLQYKRGDLQQSIAILQLLQVEHPKHPQVLRLLCKLYQATNDWQSLLLLLPHFHKAKIFPNNEVAAQLEQNIYLALLPEISHQGSKELIKFWNHAPKSVTENLYCQESYIKLLQKLGEEETAEELLRKLLKKNWQDPLGLLYGNVKGPSPKKQLAFVEKILLSLPNNACLFLTLGRLCIRNQLWGKARDYLEQSLRIEPSAEAYALIAQLMDRLGQPEKRDEYYRRGLLFVTQQ